MNRILTLALTVACIAVLTACVAPASQVDVNLLGARLQRALESRPVVVAPAPAPTPIADRKYTRVFTTNGGKTTFYDDDGTEHVVANNYQETLEVTMPAGMCPNGIYDPALPRPVVPPTTADENLDREIRRLRGPNRDQPPFFTPPGDTRSPTPEERQRLLGVK